MIILRIIGVDYGITSPGICILHNENSFYDNEFFFRTDVKKRIGKFGNIIGYEKEKNYKISMERYENNTDWFWNCVKPMSEDIIFIEDYSLGSKGRVFDLAENCAILKYKLYKSNIPFHVVAPTTIKKFATGKGNSDKFKMCEAFKNLFDIDMGIILNMKKDETASPINDLVDAYFVGQYGKKIILNF